MHLFSDEPPDQVVQADHHTDGDDDPLQPGRVDPPGDVPADCPANECTCRHHNRKRPDDEPGEEEEDRGSDIGCKGKALLERVEPG